MKTSKMQPYIKYYANGLSTDILRQLYTNMLKPRLIEEKMLVLLRQAKLANGFLE